MNNKSRTDWDRVDALGEEDIDTSDIPPITDEMFAKAQWFKPKKERDATPPTPVKPSPKKSGDKSDPT